MLEGSIVKGLLAMALPIMLANVIQSMYNIIDMRVLKQFDPGDGLAIGAVSACSNLTNLITALVIGVSTGANVIIARYIGRKDQASVDRSIASAMAFSTLRMECRTVEWSRLNSRPMSGRLRLVSLRIRYIQT